MRPSGGKSKHSKRTVSLTIDSDLYARAKALNVNVSRVAEEALAAEVARRRAEALAAEIEVDLNAANEYVAKHGSFADFAREQFAPDDDDAV
jgi:antitoxin CcdA